MVKAGKGAGSQARPARERAVLCSGAKDGLCAEALGCAERGAGGKRKGSGKVALKFEH